jgi:hypothetical protein
MDIKETKVDLPLGTKVLEGEEEEDELDAAVFCLSGAIQTLSTQGYFCFFQTRETLEMGRQDTTTVVTITVMIYYTPQFRSLVPSDTVGHIKNLVEVANRALANTIIPVRIKDHCIQELRNSESRNTTVRLQEFWRSKGSNVLQLYVLQNRRLINVLGTPNALLNTADMAILMTATPVSVF